ncbi:phage integrase SAM-like domain-containing protein [Candidatus Roizmanbacteria bacterium]|nr:phage integrase SAM-like domain-containing protein [Candidatus Roizmanbacteria bacterium]
MTDISTKRYNLDNFEASFREFLQNEHVSFPTLKNYLSDLRHFMGWFTFYLHSKHDDNLKSENTELSSLASMIDFEAVLSYKAYLESNALPPKSINRRLSTLRKFCTFCIQQNWMKENPAKRVGNVGGVPSLSLRGTSETSDAAISTNEIASSPTASRNDIIAEFKQHLLSEQDKQKDVDLIMEDVNEFLLICHPA